jgi:hypothetical protein
MKKLLLGITVLALILFASSAMAQTAKVPKALCLDYASYSDYHILYIKSLGNAPTSNGNVKMYTISGFTGTYGHPVSGSGYVIPGTTNFHATFSGPDSNRLRFYDLVFNLSANNGTIYYTFSNADASTPISSSDTVNGVSCSALAIPSAMVASDANAADSK